MNRFSPFRSAMAALSAVIVVSCQLENPLPQEDNFTVTASIRSADDTRLSFDSNTEAHTITPKWNVGDCIFGIDDQDCKFEFEVSEVSSTGIATFKTGGYTPGNATRLCAIYYPSHTSTDIDEDGLLEVDLSKQSGALDAATPVVMTAAANVVGGGVGFEFSHCCALIGMEDFSTFPNSAISEVTLGGTVTEGTIEIRDGNISLSPNEETGIATASGLDVKTDSNGKADAPVYFAVLPTKETMLSVKAKSSAGSIFNNTKVIEVAELKAGLYYRLNQALTSCKAMIVESGVGFTSFEAAMEAAIESKTDCTVRMFVNSTVDGLEINNTNAKITLDLAGCKLTMTSKIAVNSAFEITDSSAPDPNRTGGGIITCAKDTTILAGAGADLTISNGTITCSKASTYTVYCRDGADVTIQGGAFLTSTSYRPLIVKGTVAGTKNTVGTIKGGWFQCPSGQCNVVVTRETATGYKKAYLSVYGGHFKCAGTYSSSNRCFYRGYTNCTTKVYGGFFDTNSLYRYYSGEPENYTATGCEIASTETDYPEEFAAGYKYYMKGDTSEEGLKASIMQHMSETGTVNLSVLAYKKGKIVYEKAFGYRCKAKGNVDTLEVQDVYRIASITKNFVAAAMMVLLDQGKIDLDDDVNMYFNSLPEEKRISVRNPSFPSKPITIRMLLNHTSSITGSISTSNVADGLKNIKYTANEPGTVYNYTNMGAEVAGAVVELASGQRLDEFVKENILDKIKMTHSGFDASKIDTSGTVKFVHLYTAGGTRYFNTAYGPMLTPAQKANYILGYHIGYVGPAGNMKSNLEDMMRYAQTFQRGGVSPDGTRVISEANTLNMLNSKGVSATYAFYTMRNMASVPGTLLCGHNGSAYGANTYMMYGMDQDANGNAVPVASGSENDWGVIVMSSGNNNETNIGPAILKLVHSAVLR